MQTHTETPFRVRIVNVRTKDAPSAHAVEPATPVHIGTGEYTFREDILSHLDKYMRYIDLMKSADPEAYDLYSQVGAEIMSSKSFNATFVEHVGPRLHSLPSFSCISVCQSEDKDTEQTVNVKFLYYRKIATGMQQAVELRGGTLYNVVLLYADKYSRAALPLEFYISVSPGGTVDLLRQRIPRQTHMRAKSGSHWNRSYSIPTTEWVYPPALRDLARQNSMTVHDAAAQAFGILASAGARDPVAFQVRCRKNGRTATFNVAEKRTAYFFKDRDVEVNENGHRKRVFHYVPEYTKSDGTTVRAHTKGLRNFNWNGYTVHIGRPGFDFADLRAFKVGAIDAPADAPVKAGLMGLNEMGAVMLRHILTAR